MNKFTVFYSDDSKFEGDPFRKDWIKIDDTKQIVKVEYLLGKSCVMMQGYSEYNHNKEHFGLSRKGIMRILLMGRKENKSDIIILNLVEKTITKKITPLFQEYGNQILTGWKTGILNNPKSYLKK